MVAVHFDQDSLEKALKGDKPVMMDLWAPWCGPCRMAGPVIEELAEEYRDKVIIGKVNIDENQALAQKYGVMSIPTVIVFKDGKEVERKVGFPGKEGYQAMLDKIIK
jgi:thioredoxin 1